MFVAFYVCRECQISMITDEFRELVAIIRGAYGNAYRAK